MEFYYAKEIDINAQYKVIYYQLVQENSHYQSS